MATVTVIADDLTGALDTGVKFGGDGRAVVVHWRGVPPPCDVLVIDSDSRSLPPVEAVAAVTFWAGAVSGCAYKKVDSTLRGPFAAESWALAQALDCKGVLLAPAAPSLGRTVREGRLYVHGRPLEESGFRADPQYPASTGDVAAMVAAQVGVPIAGLRLDTVRAGADAVAETLHAAHGILVADTVDDADLGTLARALRLAPHWLPAGSSGLAQALAAERGWRPQYVAVSQVSRPQLAVCGSANPASHAQAIALTAALSLPPVVAHSGVDTPTALESQWRRHGVALGTLPEEGLGRERAAAALKDLVQAAAALVRGQRLQSLFVTGGETLRLLADSLGIGSLTAIGEVEAGVVLSCATLPGGQPLSIVSRAGGFGGADLLVRLMARAGRMDAPRQRC
ncbi:MAG: four-carbon acid sugar kinase family protein [Anaerolineae bacterium]